MGLHSSFIRTLLSEVTPLREPLVTKYLVGGIVSNVAGGGHVVRL